MAFTSMFFMFIIGAHINILHNIYTDHQKNVSSCMEVGKRIFRSGHIRPKSYPTGT